MLGNLIYLALNDYNVDPDQLLVSAALWSYDQNHTAWSAVLADIQKGLT